MKTIDSLRDNILNNNYESYRQKVTKINQNTNIIKIPSEQLEDLAANAQKMSYVLALINYSTL